MSDFWRAGFDEFAKQQQQAAESRRANHSRSRDEHVSLRAQVTVPAGPHLKRRRAWELYLDVLDDSKAAVLVVSKKSTFTLEDARTALRIMSEEAAARHPNGEAKGIQQFLLATRAGVAPAADAFLQGRASLARSDSVGEGGVTILRWEKLERLVQDGSIESYLATANLREKEGSGVLKAPSFTLPAWLLEERERGESAAFDLHSPFEPAGDQPEAIKNLSRGLKEGKRHQTLLGATGTVRSKAWTVALCMPFLAVLMLRTTLLLNSRFGR